MKNKATITVGGVTVKLNNVTLDDIVLSAVRLKELLQVPKDGQKMLEVPTEGKNDNIIKIKRRKPSKRVPWVNEEKNLLWWLYQSEKLSDKEVSCRVQKRFGVIRTVGACSAELSRLKKKVTTNKWEPEIGHLDD